MQADKLGDPHSKGSGSSGWVSESRCKTVPYKIWFFTPIHEWYSPVTQNTKMYYSPSQVGNKGRLCGDWEKPSERHSSLPLSNFVDASRSAYVQRVQAESAGRDLRKPRVSCRDPDRHANPIALLLLSTFYFLLSWSLHVLADKHKWQF